MQKYKIVKMPDMENGWNWNQNSEKIQLYCDQLALLLTTTTFTNPTSTLIPVVAQALLQSQLVGRPPIAVFF